MEERNRAMNGEIVRPASGMRATESQIDTSQNSRRGVDAEIERAPLELVEVCIQHVACACRWDVAFD